ncbi:MAG: hypothetical protein EXR27_16865 [Betaproteobacteria bacterium]|nr:hypothetical protein [Betaproteobacteria bacterium]
MFASISVRELRLPIIFAVVMALLGIGGLVASEFFLDQAHQKKLAAQNQREAAQDRLAKASEEEKEIRANLVHYKRMVDRGIVGPENRLDWIERIARIKAERKLFEIRYNIEPQRPLDYPGIVPAGDMDFVMSKMKLDMTLLHEGDLLVFMSDLLAAGQAHVVVRRCLMNLLDRPPTAATVPTLQIECTVDLVTLRNTKST